MVATSTRFAERLSATSSSLNVAIPGIQGGIGGPAIAAEVSSSRTMEKAAPGYRQSCRFQMELSGHRGRL